MSVRAATLPLDPRARGWTLAAAGACLLPLLLQLPWTLALGIFARHRHPQLVDQHQDRRRHRQRQQRAGDAGQGAAGNQ